MRIGLLFRVTSNRTRGNGLKLHQGASGWTLGIFFFLKSGQVLEWAARGVLELLSLDVFNKCLYVALQDKI